MANVTLRPLREDEYPAWRAGSERRYRDDMVAHGGFSEEDATAKAARDFARFLPDGLATDGHWLHVAEDAAGAAVGVVWIGRQPERPDDAFLYEIEIVPERRGEGLGRATMLAFHEEARRMGCARVALNVFGGNEVARGLYRSLGYAEAAVTMQLDLAPGT